MFPDESSSTRGLPTWWISEETTKSKQELMGDVLALQFARVGTRGLPRGVCRFGVTSEAVSFLAFGSLKRFSDEAVPGWSALERYSKGHDSLLMADIKGWFLSQQRYTSNGVLQKTGSIYLTTYPVHLYEVSSMIRPDGNDKDYSYIIAYIYIIMIRAPDTQGHCIISDNTCIICNIIKVYDIIFSYTKNR